MKQLTKMIGSLTAKFAALLLAFTCAGSAWGATLTVPGDYATIPDAFTAASAGDTIQLTADMNWDGPTALTKSLVFDLNGKTLTFTVSDNHVNGGSTVEFRNGNMVFAASSSGDTLLGIGSYSPGGNTLVLMNVKVTIDGVRTGFAAFYAYDSTDDKVNIANFTNCEIVYKNDTATTGGAFKGNTKGGTFNFNNTKVTISGNAASTAVGNAVINISNGSEFEIKGNNGNGINNCALTVTDSTLTIENNGGRGITARKDAPCNFAGNNTVVKITGSGEGDLVLNKYGTGPVVIGEGVKFTATDVKTNANSIIQDGDGNAIALTGSSLMIPPPVAKVGTKEYNDIAEAIAAWGPGKTLTLLANVEHNETVIVEVNATKSTSNWTLDLGDYTWTANGCNAFQLYAAGGTVMKQNYGLKVYANENGGITATGKYCIECKYDTSTAGYRPRLEIHGGTYTGSYIIYYASLTYNNTNISNGPSTHLFKGNDDKDPVFNGNFALAKCPITINAGVFNGTSFSTYPVNDTAKTNLQGGHFKTMSAFPYPNNNKGIVYGNYRILLNADGSIDVTNGAPAAFEASTPDYAAILTGYRMYNGTNSSYYPGSIYFASANHALQNTSTSLKTIVLNNNVVATQDKTVSSGTFTIDATAEGAAYNGTVTISGTSAKFVLVGSGEYEVTTSQGNYYVTKSTEGSTSTYSLIKSQVVAVINDESYYTDLHAALEAGKAAGSVVKLLKDIDLAGVNWVPVGTKESPFSGSIDGNGKTISNLTINNQNLDYAGLIGYGTGTGSGNKTLTIKDLTIANASITARMYAGVLGGCLYSYNSINNVKVQGQIQVTGNYKVGGVVGGGYIHAYDSSIVGDEGSFVKGLYLGAKNETVNDVVLPDDCEGDNVGGFIGHMGEGAGVGLYNCSSSGLTVMGSRKVGGLVGTLPPENSLENVNVHDITVGTTATAAYANDNKSTMEIGGVVGSYYNNGTGGVISGTVQGITIAELPEGITGTGDGKNISYGLVTGGNRGANPEPKLT